MNINPSEGFHMRLISLAINFITLYYFAAPAHYGTEHSIDTCPGEAEVWVAPE